MFFADGNLGAMQFDPINKSAKIRFSYTTFENLSLDQQEDLEEFRDDSLATVWHELYHLYDCEKRMPLYFDSKLLSSEYRDLYNIGCGFWTEYYAVYKSREYCEQHHIYDDFSDSIKTFKQQDEHKMKFMYNLSRVLGYYAHTEHDEACDNLINDFQITPELTNIIVLLKEIFNRFPGSISVKLFIELGEKVNILNDTHPKLKPFSIEDCTPVSLESILYITQIRRVHQLPIGFKCLNHAVY